jgi:hypothetical protein
MESIVNFSASPNDFDLGSLSIYRFHWVYAVRNRTEISKSIQKMIV